MRSASPGGLEVSRIGLGIRGMSACYTGASRSRAAFIRTIHRALDLGTTHIDTAEVYGPFANEELLGRTLKGRRDDAVVATEFGWSRHRGGNLERNLRIVEEVRSVGSEVGATPAQVALAWLLARGGDIARIPGTTRVSRMEENAGADEVTLTTDQMTRLDALTPAAGDRHHASGMAAIDR